MRIIPQTELQSRQPTAANSPTSEPRSSSKTSSPIAGDGVVRLPSNQFVRLGTPFQGEPLAVAANNDGAGPGDFAYLPAAATFAALVNLIPVTAAAAAGFVAGVVLIAPLSAALAVYGLSGPRPVLATITLLTHAAAVAWTTLGG